MFAQQRPRPRVTCIETGFCDVVGCRSPQHEDKHIPARPAGHARSCREERPPVTGSESPELGAVSHAPSFRGRVARPSERTLLLSASSPCPSRAFVSQNNRDKPWLFGPHQLGISDPHRGSTISLGAQRQHTTEWARVLPCGPSSDPGEDTIVFVGPPQGQARPLGPPAGLLPKAGQEAPQQMSPLALN